MSRSMTTDTWQRVGAPFTADVDFLSVTFTPDGKRLLAGTGEGRLFQLGPRTPYSDGHAVVGPRDERCVGARRRPGWQRVATASSDGTARVWSLESGALVASPFTNADGSSSLDVRRTGRLVVRWTRARF